MASRYVDDVRQALGDIERHALLVYPSSPAIRWHREEKRYTYYLPRMLEHSVVLQPTGRSQSDLVEVVVDANEMRQNNTWGWQDYANTHGTVPTMGIHARYRPAVHAV